MEYREEAVPPAQAGGVKAEEAWDRAAPSIPQAIGEALDEIEQRLQQMLALARLSSSDSDVDRAALQKKLERLKKEIDEIADGIAGI